MSEPAASSPDRLRVAAVQHAPVFLDLEASLERAESLVAQAAADGAELVAFPETWLPTYPVWLQGSAGWEDPRAKEAYSILLRNSVSVPGPAADRLAGIARRHGVFLVMGCNERDTYSRGTLYNTQLFFDETGRLVGRHRKLVPTHAERLVWGQGDGSTLGVVESARGHRIGGLICWEHWMPLARHVMHAQGEQVHIASWPELGDTHELASRHYAFEGRCFVVVAATYLAPADVPESFFLRDAMWGDELFGEGIVMPGGSGVIGPDGAWIAGPVYGRHEIVHAEIDLRAIEREQLALDTVGHYARPDVFRLTVDTRPRAPFLPAAPESLA